MSQDTTLTSSQQVATSEIRATTAWHVEQVDRSGNARITAVATELDIKGQAFPSISKEFAVSGFQMAPDGKTTDITGMGILAGGRSSIPTFPKTVVRPGDTWTGTAYFEVVLGTPLIVSGKLTYKLLGVADVQEALWTKISFHGDIGAPKRRVPMKRIIGVKMGQVLVAGDKGVQVQEVEPDSPAAKSGVLPGDIITRFAGFVITSPAELSLAIAMSPEGSSELQILRQGKTLEFTLKPVVTAWANVQADASVEGTVMFDATCGIIVRIASFGGIMVDIDGQVIKQEYSVVSELQITGTDE